MPTTQLLTLCVLLAQPAQPGEPGEPAGETTDVSQGMRQRAEQTTVVVADGERRTATLTPQPLFRYSDQPRDIIAATFWGWQSGGRPAAFQKIELYRREGKTHWFYCLASASPQRIEVRWKVGGQWSAEKPGVVMQTLPDSPAAAKRKVLRLRQLRQLARRFSVQLVDEIADTQQELRLLPQPIQRYNDGSAANSDGAVFGFAGNGTNPDALLLIETRPGVAAAGWQYAWIQMTTGKLTARLDQQVVWTAPYRTPNPAAPSKFDTWLFFHESAVR